jgi:hypothetical protein
MSGGSYDYACYRIKDFASQLMSTDTNPKRKAFKHLLEKVAEAAHAIEWVDSGDYGTGDEDKYIEEVFNCSKIDKDILFKAHAYDAIVKVLKNATVTK